MKVRGQNVFFNLSFFILKDMYDFQRLLQYKRQDSS